MNKYKAMLLFVALVNSSIRLRSESTISHILSCYNRLQSCKVDVTPAQAMDCLTRPKISRKSSIEHLMYLNAVSKASCADSDYLVLNAIAQYASQYMIIALIAKVDHQRTRYLYQAEELSHFVQS